MANVADVRTLMVAFHSIAHALNEDEISALATVLYAELDRMEKEAT